jgi:hypothetical protein
MRNKTRNTKTFTMSLLAGAIAVASIAPLQAQMMGGAGIRSMGQVGGQVGGGSRDMSNIHALNVNHPDVTRAVGQLPQQVVASGMPAAQALQTAAGTRDAMVGVAGQTAAQAGSGVSATMERDQDRIRSQVNLGYDAAGNAASNAMGATPAAGSAIRNAGGAAGASGRTGSGVASGMSGSASASGQANSDGSARHGLTGSAQFGANGD